MAEEQIVETLRSCEEWLDALVNMPEERLAITSLTAIRMSAEGLLRVVSRELRDLDRRATS